MFSDGRHCPSNLKLTWGESARQFSQVSRYVVAQLLLKLNPCCCLQRCLQHQLLTTDRIQHLVILLLLSRDCPSAGKKLCPCLVPSKSTDTEVFSWETVGSPISQGPGGCCLSWSPLPRVAIAMAAWWEPVTANSSIPTQPLAPYGNELSGLHNWDDSFQLCCALSLQPIPSGRAGSSAQVLCPGPAGQAVLF